MSYYTDSTAGKSNFVQDSNDKATTLPMRVRPQRNIHQQMQRQMQSDQDTARQAQKTERLLYFNSYVD